MPVLNVFVSRNTALFCLLKRFNHHDYINIRCSFNSCFVMKNIICNQEIMAKLHQQRKTGTSTYDTGVKYFLHLL